MSSSSSLNSKSRPGSGSPVTHSESASGSTSKSVSGSTSESASRSMSGSSHGSFSTSPKRNKKFPISKLTDEHAGPSTLAKFEDRLAKNPWEAFDRMHRSPKGFSAFSIKHLDAGLRFPLAPPIASILNKLGLCPIQLSPNSMSHIVLFVVIAIPSRGFFYLSAKPDCGYLSALKSNVGVWLDRYIFIRSPRGVWPFKNEWTKYKPIPKTSGGGLEGDQIRSLKAYKYDPKKLLTEKVLQLSGLSPASLHIEESLGDFSLPVPFIPLLVCSYVLTSLIFADNLIMSSRNAIRMIAAQNKLRKGKEVAASSDPPSGSPSPVPSKALVSASPVGQQPILVDSEETPSTPGGHHGYNSSELELNLDEVSGDQGVEQERRGPPTEERPKKRKRSSPKRGSGNKAKQGPNDKGKGKEPAETSNLPQSKLHSSNVLSRMTREAAEKTGENDNRDKFFRVAQLVACWEESRAALRGNQPPPKWDSMSSSTLYGEAGNDTFDLYDSIISVRDQGSLVTNNPIRLEEFGAHSLIQAMTFLRSLTLKCTHYRRSFIQTDQKRDEADLKHADSMLVLGEKVTSIEAELDAARKEREVLLSEKEVALAEAKREAFEAGREEGHKHGVEEGQAGRIPIEEHQQVLANSRMSAVRDFLKTDTFTTALELNSADSYAKGYETCLSQITKLGGLQESFGRGQLSIALDGGLQPYPADPDLKDDEFMALRDELEAEANA
ncbi:UNVERIFIED_CONTAM: hypothetical protein Sindi_0971800 [Sesamum indicum]